MRRRNLWLAVLSFFFVYSFTVLCDEPASDDTPVDEFSYPYKEEYTHIFKSIPVLFEYLLVALQDRPEVLETDNIMAFNDVSKHKRSGIEKRDADNYDDLSPNSLNNDFKEMVKRDSDSEHNLIERDKNEVNSKNKRSENDGKDFHGTVDNGKVEDKNAGNKENDRPLEANNNFDQKGVDENNVRKNDDEHYFKSGSRYGISDVDDFDDDETPNQEAADVFDEIESEEVFSDDSDTGKMNEEDTGGFQFTLEEAQEKILLVEKELEQFNMHRDLKD